MGLRASLPNDIPACRSEFTSYGAMDLTFPSLLACLATHEIILEVGKCIQTTSNRLSGRLLRLKQEHINGH